MILINNFPYNVAAVLLTNQVALKSSREYATTNHPEATLPFLFQKKQTISYKVVIVEMDTAIFSNLLDIEIPVQIDGRDFIGMIESAEAVETAAEGIRKVEVIINEIVPDALSVENYNLSGGIDIPYNKLELSGDKMVHSFYFKNSYLVVGASSVITLPYSGDFESLIGFIGTQISMSGSDLQDPIIFELISCNTSELIMLSSDDLTGIFIENHYQLDWTINNAFAKTYTTRIMPFKDSSTTEVENAVVDGKEVAKGRLVNVSGFDIVFHLSTADALQFPTFWQKSERGKLTLYDGNEYFAINFPQPEFVYDSGAIDCVPMTLRFNYKREIWGA